MDESDPVEPAPTLTTASPNVIAAYGSVTFSGTGFEAGATVTIAGASAGVKASKTSVVNSTTVTADNSVPVGTITGAYTVKITNPDHSSASCTNCQSVIAAPTLSSLSPSTVAVRSTTSVTLGGSGFASGATLKGPSGVTFTNVVVVNSTTITATMKVTSSAPTGSHLSVTVTNDAAAGYGKVMSGILTIT